MSALPKDVTIVGAGLAGTALAIAFQQQSVPCRIYESRSPQAPEVASGIILTPNGLRILDQLGVLARIAPRCWKVTHRTFKNDKDETTRKILIANEELYGYRNHRVWRRWLLEEMKLMLAELKIPIVYNSKFEGIVSDTIGGVTFRINGKEETASMLVGTDGIYSSVRKYLAPEIRPEYTGVLGLIGHIKTDSVRWPYPDYEKQFTLQGKPGAFFTMPENAEGSEIMVGYQIQHPDQSRAEWESLVADKDRLCEFVRRGYDEWHDTGRQIIDQVCAEKHLLYAWPFLRMPKLERWYSSTGKVIILGDAAHAIPPSSGQGTNQAMEDIYSLMLLLKNSTDVLKALGTWQELRQARINVVFDWATNSTNVQRLPEAERNRLIKEGKAKDPKTTQDFDNMGWLYKLDLNEEISRITASSVHG